MSELSNGLTTKSKNTGRFKRPATQSNGVEAMNDTKKSRFVEYMKLRAGCIGRDGYDRRVAIKAAMLLHCRTYKQKLTVIIAAHNIETMETTGRFL